MKSQIRRSVYFLLCLLLAAPCMGEEASNETQDFVEKIPAFGVIKPGEITTLLAINHGMVAKIPFQVGDRVKLGDILLSAIERETTRGYRTTIRGQVAKLHVTPGAALTPGMPLVTVINPEKKQIEVSLSPKESQRLKVGAPIFLRGKGEQLGHLSKISPLVDPETGAVLSYVQPEKPVAQLIGDVIPLDIEVRHLKDCFVTAISEIDQHIEKYRVEATSGNTACLIPKTSSR
ncbi:MAG: HlyD family efflux transporter periplasmic adaptor subunit [Bdellovibrionales bacterium]|nr:HlyD family efflux transporter periplasmic adaptor subunit [Bdellovibrionales bacterium]